MAGTGEIITREPTGTDPLVPEAVTQAVIQELPKASAAMALMNRVQLTSKSGRQPVLTSLPNAYWVGGDTGLKQTTKATWENVTIVAEELAALVAIPDAYFDDSAIPLWDTIRPMLVEAIGAKVDSATLFGTDKPATWTSPSVVPGAVAVGNVIADGAGGDDLGQNVAALGELLASQGYNLRAFASVPGLDWRLVGLRNADGNPIYGNPMALGQPGTLYGRPLNAVENGAWEDGVTLIGADFSKFAIGVRQEITFKIFTEGVISDDDGKVILNLMQQDSKVMRVVFRVGYVMGNPATRMNPDSADRFPAGIVGSWTSS